MRRRLAISLFVASAVVVVATPVVVSATRPRVDAGRLPAPTRPAPAGAVSAVEGSAPTTSWSPPAIEVRSARLEDAPRVRTGPRPVAVRIPAIGLRASVVPVGVVAGSGTVEVPSDVDQVGWYRFGPAPGVHGSAVLLGHVDSRTQGPGAFFRLRELAPGAVVSVVFATGDEASFVVVARRSYPKDRLPPAIFARAGRPLLALVTCGGSFDESSRSYSDNVVVFAVPRGAA